MVGTPVGPRPLTTADKVDALDTFIDAVKSVTNDVGDVFTDRPAFVAGNEPRGPLGDAVRAVTRLNCRQWARSDKSGFSTRVNAYNGEVCGPYLDSLGENPDSPTIAPLLEGGQCPGVSYRVYATNENGARFLVGEQNGPITVRRGDNWRPDNRELIIGYPGSPNWRAVYNATVDVERSDGNPDECGNGEPNITPPSTVTPVTPVPPSITVGLPGVGPVDVTVDITVTGDPQICIPVLGVCETITIGPPERGPAMPELPGGGGGLPPGDVGSPSVPQLTGPNGEAEGAAPPGTVLVGLRLDTALIPDGAREYAPETYRGAAYVYMGTPAGLDQDFAGSILRDGQFIFAEKENLTRWAVRGNNGFSWSVTPYYREVEL